MFGQQAGGDHSGGIEGELSRGLAALAALPEGKRAAAEIRYSQLLAENAPEAVRLYDSLAAPAKRRTLLRLMTLSGNADFLRVVHRILAAAPEAGAPAGRDGTPGEEVTVGLLAAATFALRESAPRVRPFLLSPDPHRTALALHYFAAQPRLLRGEEFAHLLEDRHPPVMAALLELLLSFPGERSRAYCLEALKHPLQAVAAGAARCLARLGDAAHRAALLRAFEAGGEGLRVEVVRTLHALDPAGSAPMFRHWLRHNGRRVALAALLAVQEMNERGTVPLLMELIESGESAVPEGVLIKSLGLFRDRRALAFLGGRLRSEADVPLKLVLIEALGDLGALEGQRHLLDPLSAPDPRVRGAANRALKKIAAWQMERNGGTGR